ncbi:MAG: polyphosphate kinase 1 [Bacteroidota bacterium]
MSNRSGLLRIEKPMSFDTVEETPEHNRLRREFPANRRLINRELSWLDFNQRVLEEAFDPTVPILERVKFLAIVSSNLDEYFMVRVALVRRQIEAGISKRGPDGLRPAEVMERINRRVHRMHEDIGDCFRNHITPALRAENIHLLTEAETTAGQQAFAQEFFREKVVPLVAPLPIDPLQPFPLLENATLYFCVNHAEKKSPRKAKRANLALVKIPTKTLGRFLRLPSAGDALHIIRIDDVIRLFLTELFPNSLILGSYEIKVVRDSDLQIDEVGSEDLMRKIINALQKRGKAQATRFLHDPEMPKWVVDTFASRLKLPSYNIFAGARYHSFSDLMQFPDAVGRLSLRDPEIPPQSVPKLEACDDPFTVLRSNDVLLHHPYQSFATVSRFFERAAEDDAVVSMKAALYRVTVDSPIASALVRAARSGKLVTVVVELRARFDEDRNISWARRLEEAGAHVIYGVDQYKTHCKIGLVERKEGDRIRRYCHLGTGNYNERTSQLYTDVALLTAHDAIGVDVAKVFNLLTGGVRRETFSHLPVAPLSLRSEFVRRIRREARHTREGRPARIVAKMNSLVDPHMIDELYLASRAGVRVQLIVRGICCLRPGVPGLSDNIEVISIIDRFLEHARIYFFQNDDQPEIFVSSADWMPRNLNKRVEVAFPILDAKIAGQVQEILEVQLGDNVKARVLNPDGSSKRRQKESGAPVRSQEALFQLAQRQALQGT